jgi:hypothetical protein
LISLGTIDLQAIRGFSAYLGKIDIVGEQYARVTGWSSYWPRCRNASAFESRPVVRRLPAPIAVVALL